MHLTARPRKLVPSKTDISKLLGAIDVCDDVAQISPDNVWRDHAVETKKCLFSLATYLDPPAAPDEPGVDTAEEETDATT